MSPFKADITCALKNENKYYRLLSFLSVEQVRRPITPHRGTQPSKTYIKMEVNIIELARHCPDVTISVKASDLVEMGRTLCDELLDGIRATQPETAVREDDSFISREETMVKLDVSSATLWRWKKSGYLVPVQLGCMDRYRLSDVNAIITKRGGAL